MTGNPLAGRDVLLVAHGSRSPAAAEETERLRGLVADLAPDARGVSVGYLELTEPPAGAVLSRLAAGGATRVVVVPLMLHSADHAKSDVPAVVLEGRQRWPALDIRYARPLGVDHALLALARRRVAEAGGSGLPLLMVSRGSSDPDANAEACRVARLVADMTGAPHVVAAFSGITWPSVPDALDQLRRLGHRRVAAFAWFLATGVLLDRLGDQIAEFNASTGIEVVQGGYLGVEGDLARAVVDRAVEAVEGTPAANCDLCAYRVPFPGVEHRVGAPAGVGHSHLAAEHRHSHDQ